MAIESRTGLSPDESRRLIRPIETIYRGIRFRSRLEAVWAVFFDLLGWRWVYEAQGYQDLFGEMRYLPDFLLADFNVYVEIKPLGARLDDQRTLWLAHNGNRPVLTLFGVPGSEHQAKYQAIEETIVGADIHECSAVSNLDQRPCDGPIAIIKQPPLYVARQVGNHQHRELSLVWAEIGTRKRVEPAIRAARGARFEHGERGEDRLSMAPEAAG